MSTKDTFWHRILKKLCVEHNCDYDQLLDENHELKVIVLEKSHDDEEVRV